MTRNINSRIGVCASIDNAVILKKAGCSFIEENLQRLVMPLASDKEFRENYKKANTCQLPVKALNCFLPKELICIGPKADIDRIITYTEVAFKRASSLNIELVVFGSGAARTIPEGVSRTDAEEQFVDLLRILNEIAIKNNIIICLENLRKAETNFLNNVKECLEIVRKVDSPSVMLLVDIYHMLQEDESPDIIKECKGLVKHVHIAEKEGRSAPGVHGDDFREYLKALNDIEYEGLYSIECKFTDFEKELKQALYVLSEQLESI